MNRHCSYVTVVVGLAFSLCAVRPVSAQTAPPLGALQPFAVLAETAVTNSGGTVVSGDLGVSPGTAVTGFAPGVVLNGAIHAGDTIAASAKLAAAAVNDALTLETCTQTITGSISSVTLTPGVYCSASSISVVGTIFLDGGGDRDAVFIFKIAGPLTATSGASIALTNGTRIDKVFWQVGGATIGTTAQFVGNVLSSASLILNTGAVLQGRALSLSADVILDTNAVIRPVAAATLSKAFAPATFAVGGTTRLTFTLTNPDSIAQGGLDFTDSLPSDLVVAALPAVANTCAGVVTAAGSTISLAGGSLGGGLTCTIEVDVTHAPGATIPQSCPAPSLTNDAANITGLSASVDLAPGFGACVSLSAVADLTVVKTPPAQMVAGLSAVYSLSASNAGPSPAVNVTVSDVLPATLAFVSGIGCSAVGQTVSCSPNTLAVGQVVNSSFTVTVAPDVPAGAIIMNTATIGSTTPDSNPSNNTSTIPSPAVATSADLSTSAVTVGASVSPGGTFGYRITVANAGPSVARDVTVTQVLPLPLTFVASFSGCTAAGQTVTCTRAIVAQGASEIFDLTVRLAPTYAGTGGDLVTTASVTATTPDAAPGNNGSGPIPAPPIGIGEADLTIVSTGPYGTAPAGSQITYTIVVTNQGPDTARDVVVSDTTPAGLTFVGTTGDCTTVFPCALGTMAAGAAKTIAATYTVNPGGPAVIANTATVSALTPDPSPATNTATAMTPPDAVTYYLAEGATGTFWNEDVSIANPSAEPAPVTMSFFTESGTVGIHTLTLAPFSHVTVRVDDLPGLASTSTFAEIRSESGRPLGVERTMTWDATAYGGHTETAVTRPATRWFFAEGSQGFFETYLLLGNTSTAPADVTVTFLREAGAPVVRSVTIGPRARLTVSAGTIPELSTSAFGIVVDATQPIVAERSMYFGTTATRLWSGGHASAGVSEPSRRWFYAEGATGSFFDTFVLLSNPEMVEAHVTMEYLLPNGEVVIAPKVVPAQGRLTVGVDNETDARLHASTMGIRVTSDVPIVTERSIYWDSKPDVWPWSEGHNSFGLEQTASRWALAQGRVGGPDNAHTYILLANPWETAAEVTVTYLREEGAPVAKNYTVAPKSRVTIAVNDTVPELANETFGASIAVTNGQTIGVEQSVYWDGNGVFWVAGANAVGTKLP